MILCHVWIYPLSLLDSVCFISVILILLFTFTLVLQMNLNCFCHVYRRKFMNVTLTLIGCWLISFAQMDFHWMIFYTVTPPYHLFVAVAIKTLDGELIRACDQTYNTGKPRKSGIQEIVGVWFCSTLIIKHKCFCCFFGQVPPNWISRIIVFKRKFGGVGGCKWNDQLLVKKNK